MKPPTTIHIKSDGNELSFVNIMKPKDKERETIYVYEYTKSKTKKGKLLQLTEQQLNKIIQLNS